MVEELYRGNVRFYIGTLSEERVGEIIITEEFLLGLELLKKFGEGYRSGGWENGNNNS